MVFLDSFSMSSPKPRQGPSPPTVEQILEDNVDNIDSSDNESDSDLNTNEVLNDNYVNL